MEHADNWFEIERPSPSVLESVLLRLDKGEQILGITHRDGLCRIQTVAESDALESFYELLT